MIDFKDDARPLVTWANIFNFWAKLNISDRSRASPPTNRVTRLGYKVLQLVPLHTTRLGHRRGPKAPVLEMALYSEHKTSGQKKTFTGKKAQDLLLSTSQENLSLQP